MSESEKHRLIAWNRELSAAHQRLRRALRLARDALDAGDEAEAERLIGIGAAFVRDHLLPWAPEMLATAIGRAHTHFMRGVGLLSLGALASYVELVDAS